MPGTSEQTVEPLVSLQDISCRFGPVLANDGVGFDLRAGQVHALVGENGAGKTTLMRILAGFLRPDSGRIIFQGEAQPDWDSSRARRAGIGMVHQHLMLIDALTVLENVLLAAGEGGFDPGTARRRLTGLASDFHLALDPDELVGELDGPRRQWVAIARAFTARARVLVLDEPTAFIGPRETERLLLFIRRQADQGRAVAFISHKLPEVTAVADRITVLRRGRVVGDFARGQASEAEIARLMVGDGPADRTEPVPLCRRPAPGGRSVPTGTEPGASRAQVVLELDGVSLPHGRLRKATFSVLAGEVLGVAGVAGNGQQELVELLLGLGPRFDGEVVLVGRRYRGRLERARRREVMAQVPGQVRRRGLVPAMTVQESCLLGHQRRGGLSRAGWLPRLRVRELARRVTSEAGLAVALDAPTSTLSGGMGQRLVVARALAKPHQLLLAEQPTAGLDVGAARWVRRALRREVEEGRGVVLISYDVDELLAVSDRVAVLYDGRVVGPFPRDELSRERLADLMAGVGVEDAGR